MIWTQETKKLFSEDRKYLITNEGQKGGDGYCLWTTKEHHHGYCLMLGMGTFNEMKLKAERLKL
jgi:predicted secreted protein